MQRQPEDIFRSRVPHSIYVSTESGELGVVLQDLGYVRDGGYGFTSGTYLLGSNRNHAITAVVNDLDLQEALLKQQEFGFHPQSRIILNSNGNQQSYEQNALRLVAALAKQGQWFAVYGLSEPYVHREEDWKKPKILQEVRRQCSRR